jgi:cold shock CspA family protein
VKDLILKEKAEGVVVCYKKGGYAWLDHEGEHVFCHIQDVKGRTVLHEGDLLEFRLVSSPKGLRALKAIIIQGRTFPATEAVSSPGIEVNQTGARS